VNDVEYTYGTDAAAAARLEDINRYFNPRAADFIRRFASGVPGIAMDLGCGPGFTTDMLAQATGCRETYGLDSSPAFLEMARRRFSHCKFLEHDITSVPFPVTADLMYSRFLLCHLRDPLDVLRAWTIQLNPGGTLFVEEMDAIDTDLEVFRTYLAIGERIIGTQGASMCVGRSLAAAEYDADVLFNEPVQMPVANRQAASWFFPNTQTIWSENPYVLDHLTPEEREPIASELAQLKERKDSRSDITWTLRRVVLRRRTD